MLLNTSLFLNVNSSIKWKWGLLHNAFKVYNNFHLKSINYCIHIVQLIANAESPWDTSVSNNTYTCFNSYNMQFARECVCVCVFVSVCVRVCVRECVCVCLCVCFVCGYGACFVYYK